MTRDIELSVLVVSYNTRDVLRDCLHSIETACDSIRWELIVIDNASHDGSADMVAKEFPQVHLIRAPKNLGFAAANNLGWKAARGRYIALINPDAFPAPCSLSLGVARMRAQTEVALAGGLLLGRGGAPEPSARKFPSPLNDFLAISGLAARHARSRFFGRFDRTWADPELPASVDWVPGAFCLIRSEALGADGLFDERFFLYYEEVDLCRRLREAGYTIAYWPDLKAVHWGGESSRTVEGQTFSSHGSQLTLWRMRSALLYYRKHHGWLTAGIAAALESGWHRMRRLRHRTRSSKAAESEAIITCMRRAWRETRGGRVCPPRPW